MSHAVMCCHKLSSVLLFVVQMLSSVQGMVEKTRQSMAVLKERVNATHIEMERREVRKRTMEDW